MAALGAHTYWRRPELTGIEYRSRGPRRWHRVLGAILGALWGASMTWAGLVLLSPGRDITVSIWLPWRWWRVFARLVALLVVLVPALLAPALLLWLLFDVDLVAGMAVTSVVIVLGTAAMAWLEIRLRQRRAAPMRLPGMVSITGLASHSASPWAPSRFLRDEFLRWADDHNVALYAAIASPAHARLYRGAGFVPASERGPLALIRPAANTLSHSAGTASGARRKGLLHTIR